MEPGSASLFNQIIVDWQRFATSRKASRRLRAWTVFEPALAGIEDVTELITALRDSVDLDGRDHRWRALLRVARTDADAQRAAIYALWPGLNRVAQMYGRRWEYEDTAAEVIGAALERIARYPVHRRSSPAANIVRDAQNRLHARRSRERALNDALGARVGLGDADAEEEVARRSASEELLSLLDEGVRCGRVSRRGARLILLYRVLDVPTEQVASLEGRRAVAVHRARQRAESALTPAAVA